MSNLLNLISKFFKNYHSKIVYGLYQDFQSVSYFTIGSIKQPRLMSMNLNKIRDLQIIRIF